MKKIIISLVVLLFSMPTFAQLVQGQHLVGGRLGLGFQLENSGISYSPYDRVDWGTLGVDYGLAYYYLLNPYVGVGADVSYGDFEGGQLFVLSEKVDDKTKVFNTMLSARFTANPSDLFRWYMPVGAGLTVARQNMRIKRSGVNYHQKATDASFGWFVGAGFEFDLGRESTWSVGLETRYNTFRFDTDKLVRHAPAAVKGDGNRRLSYMSFQLRVNKKF